MHVLFLASWFETPSRPTAGKAVKDLALALTKQGISINIFFQSSDKLPFAQMVDGIKVYHSFSLSKGRMYPILSTWTVHDFLNAIRKYFSLEGIPDLVHVHGYTSLVFAHALFKKYQIPFIYTEHSSQIAQNKINNFQKKWIINKSAHAKYKIGVSNYLVEAMNKYLSQVIVIPNTIDFDLFTFNDNKKDQWIMINLLNENKQVSIGIDIFKKWIQKNPKTSLHIIGDGPLRKKLEKSSEGLNITFWGERKSEEWKDLLAESSCLLLFSKSETFGVVLLEALACGVPVLCFDNGGVLDIQRRIPNALGMLTILPQNSTDAEILLGIEMLLKNYDKDKAQKCREVLSKSFGYAVIANQYIRLYHS